MQNSLQANIADIAGSIAGIAGFEGAYCRYIAGKCSVLRKALQSDIAGIAGRALQDALQLLQVLQVIQDKGI